MIKNSELEKELIQKYLHHKNAKYEVPYIYNLQYKNHFVMYCGTRHTIENGFADIRSLIECFKTFNPDLLVVEGITWISKYENLKLKNFLKDFSDDEIIARFGENIYFLNLASNNNIPVISPEPSLFCEMKYVCSHGFSSKEFFKFYSLKLAKQWQVQYETKISFIDKCDRYMKTELQEIYLKYRTYFIKELRKLLCKYSRENIIAMIDPVPRSPILSYKKKYCQISMYSNIRRDIELINCIKKNCSYHRIMIIFGATHAYVQRDFLENLNKNSARDITTI